MDRTKLYTALVFLFDFASEKNNHAKYIGEIIYALSPKGQQVLAEIVHDYLFDIAYTPTCDMYKLIKSNPDMTVDDFLRYTQDKRFNEVRGVSYAPFPKFAQAMTSHDIIVNLPRWFEQLKEEISE